jgi:adenosylcobinamide-phosphate synthase
MLELTGILFFAFVIDLFIGDPIYRLHPVRIVGNGISIAEKVLRKFGWAGARLDDLLNFIPAQMSLGILFAGAWISGLHPLDGIRVALRDRKKHDSSNAGHAESFVAGALHIRLNGPIRYPDGLKNKPCLGDGSPDVGPMHIRRTALLIRCSAWIAMVASISALLLLV